MYLHREDLKVVFWAVIVLLISAAVRIFIIDEMKNIDKVIWFAAILIITTGLSIYAHCIWKKEDNGGRNK